MNHTGDFFYTFLKLAYLSISFDISFDPERQGESSLLIE